METIKALNAIPWQSYSQGPQLPSLILLFSFKMLYDQTFSI